MASCHFRDNKQSSHNFTNSSSDDDEDDNNEAANDSASGNAKSIFMLFNVLCETVVFAIPSAVHFSGWLLFILSQVLLAFISSSTSFYLLHAMQVNAIKPQSTANDHEANSNAETEDDHDKQSVGLKQKLKSKKRPSGKTEKTEHTPLISKTSSSDTDPDSPLGPLPKSSQLLGLPHLCCHYGGRWLFYIYVVTLWIYLLFALWAVCAVFTTQLSASIMALFFNQDCYKKNSEANPEASCQFSYYSSLGLLTICGLIWVYFDTPLSEKFSTGTSVFRLVGFALIAVTAAAALLGGGALSPEATPHSPANGTALIGALSMLPADGHSLKGFSMALVYAILSYNVSYDLAEIFGPDRWSWRPKKQSQARSPSGKATLLVTLTILAILFLHVLVGILCAALFGDSAKSLIGLHWRGYSGTKFDNTVMASFSTPIPMWARISQLSILFFPILSAIASLPYLAVDLSRSITRFVSFDPNNAHESFIKHPEGPPAHIPGGDTTIALLSVVPPLILTAFVNGDLGEIILLTAPFALFIQYVLPAVLLLLIRYGPNAEPDESATAPGKEASETERAWYMKSGVLITLLVLSLTVSLVTIVLLCVHALWQ